MKHLHARSRVARRALGTSLAVLALVATACSGNQASTDESTASDGSGDPVEMVNVGETQLDSGLGSRAENRRITFLLSQDPGDSFWGTITRGAEDAAALFNVDLNVQTSQGDQATYIDQIGTAVADQPAGLAVVLDDPNAYTEAVCDAADAGIAVMSYNITQEGDVADCLLGFVGQDFEQAGFLLGQRLLQEVPDIGEGDVVFTPVEFPEQVYAIQRRAGVQRALDEVGATTDPIATGIDDAGALDAITQYLIGHQDVAAIVPLGGTPHRNVVQAMTDAGIEVPVVGFDLSQPVIDGIKSGQILAAADQQPYIQGFQTVAQLALHLDFGISPATINSGGGGLVDGSNVDIVEELAGTIR